ncbi:MAG: hypothetical protein IKH06_01845 [Clostridiales bacterium]|nr:hypothetical protein [Clostridiales bacterium]
MEEKNRGDRILDGITKTILIIILIFGLMILCGYLYLRSFMNRVIESERASMATQTTESIEDYNQSLKNAEIDEVLYGGH